MALADARYRSLWTRRPDFTWQPPGWLAAVSVGLTGVLYVIVGWSARFPVLPLDEIMMVGNSRVIAGVQGDWPLSGSGFMPGLAILMAPIWWFTDSALMVYQVGIWMTVALALLAIWPLSSIAKRAGMSRPAGVIISALVMMAPARALLANYLLAESALLLATAALLVAADRLWKRLRTSDALWFGAAVGATALSHTRGLGTAVAAGLWTLLLIRRDPKRAILAGASAATAAIGAWLFYRAVTNAVIGDDLRVSNAFGDLGGRDMGASLASFLGQLWYGTVAWPALAVLGGMAMAKWCRKGGMASLVVLGVAVGLILSTVQLNPRASSLRMDPWFYGRYMDQWWPILAIFGLAILVRVKWPLMSAIALGASVLSGLAMLFVTVPSMPKGMQWVAVHVLGITPWLRLDAYANGRDQSWPVIVLTGVALTLLLLALGYLRVWVLPTLAALWIWLSLAQDFQGIDIGVGPRGPIADRLARDLIPEGSVVGLDPYTGAVGNFVVFGIDPQPVIKVDPLDLPDGMDMVFVSDRRANEAPPGVNVLGPTLGMPFVAWVEPGEFADTLDEKGLLAVRK